MKKKSRASSHYLLISLKIVYDQVYIITIQNDEVQCSHFYYFVNKVLLTENVHSAKPTADSDPA